MTPVIPAATISCLPGFLNADTGPTTDPAFHVKARSTRFGANLEWPDISPKIELTGTRRG